MNKEDKILVTGGLGMVGKSLILKLRKLGFEKIISPSSKELDLKERDKVFQFFEKELPDFVFHLAAKVGGIKANIENPVDFLRDNLLINTNVIDACYKFKIKKLINLGSSCIYPKESPQPMKEEHLLSGKLEPTNEGYALSKICSLKLCKYYNDQYKTNFISLMPPNMYGENDHFGLEKSHVISALIRKFHDAKMKSEKEVLVWGTGNARREFFYVGDMVDALIFAMKNINPADLVDNCFLNCGVGEDISIKDLAFLIKKIIEFEGEIKFDSSKPEGMKLKLLDISKIKSLGFQPKTNLNEGLKRAYDSYLKLG